MKKIGFIKLAFLSIALSLFFVQCAKDDVVTQLDSAKEVSTDTINTYDGTWDLESHSRLFAHFPYYGENIDFEAEFILWDMEIEFYADKPENSKIEGVVLTRSIQTGAPAGTNILPGAAADGTDSVKTNSGRDGEIFNSGDWYLKASDGVTGRKFANDFYLNGCLTKPKGTAPAVTASTVGITHDGTSIDAYGRFLPSGITNESDKATFKSTSIEFYGTGYVATGNFVWNGITKEVKLYFEYLGTGEVHGYRTLEGQFEFPAFVEEGSADNFINDSHVQSGVTVMIHAQFKK